jgi:hypothetical protein
MDTVHTSHTAAGYVCCARSLCWKRLEDNEGKIADEVRIRRIKHWREEALEQLRLNT